MQGAEADLARTEWAARDQEREIVAETTKAFTDLVVAQERLTLSREALNLASGLRDTAKELVDTGTVPEIDLLRANVEMRRATNRVRLDEVAIKTASAALALLIGAPAEVTLRGSGPLLLDAPSASLEELIARARERRPDLRGATAALESAHAALRLVRAERFFPSITLSASYGEGLEFDSRTRTALFGVSMRPPAPIPRRRAGGPRHSRSASITAWAAGPFQSRGPSAMAVVLPLRSTRNVEGRTRTP